MPLTTIGVCSGRAPDWSDKEIKTALQMGSSKKLSGNGALRELQPHSVPSIGLAAGLLGLTVTVDCWFQSYHIAGKQGLEIGQVELPQSSLFLPEFHFFFPLPKCFLAYCKPLASIQSSEKAASANFGMRSLCFYGGEDFLRSLLHHFH